MRRFISLSRSDRSTRRASVADPSPDSPPSDEKGSEDVPDSSTTVSTPLAPPSLKVKKVDNYYSRWSKGWKYKNMGSNVIAESRPKADGDPWSSFCFVVIRTLPREPDQEPTFQIQIKSPYLLAGLKETIGEVTGISWNSDPMELDPHFLLAFLPQIEASQAELKAKKNRTEEQEYIMSSVAVLVDYLRYDYRSTLASIAHLLKHGEISFKYIFALMVPKSILVTNCPSTGEPRAFQLMTSTKHMLPSGRSLLELLCENIDAVDNVDASKKTGTSFGRVQSRILLEDFRGTVKITSLEAFPLSYHPKSKQLEKSLIERGRKWASLAGVHHRQYNGQSAVRCQGKVIKYNLNSRIMIDRDNFKRVNANYEFPQKKPEVVADDDEYDHRRRRNPVMNASIPTLQTQNVKVADEPPEFTDNELLLASPIVYGFSLGDKLWLEFNVEKVEPVEWTEDAFENLVLPPGRKTLLRSLVEAHNQDLGFDDFVRGKGHGLVINLFGPPGVGKTLSAEATSEHVRRPLYVVGAGDLGMGSTELDTALTRVFDIATSWKAIVLIDEADVFLEQRSLHDMMRNAMVAIFLRHVEYYRGILFLTTNRVKAFDEAFLSRIHVALHFQPLTPEIREQVWTAFLTRAGVKIGGESGITDKQLRKLSSRDINGRQVKNATRTANSLAVSRKEKLSFAHLSETLDAMEEFEADFEAMHDGVERKNKPQPGGLFS